MSNLLFAEEVWRADWSEHPQPVAQGDGKGSRPPTGLWQTGGISPMSTSCGGLGKRRRERRTSTYAKVSSAGQKGDQKAQWKALARFFLAQGKTVDERLGD
ncbi:hypothetical protein A7K73_03145 [Candidatus Methylacidiphilum fumarolicum]|uniref:hypothetical protein n=1 Tax=Candidatus Methylacidiphilum fumarolicum TaxID=591154 RepID=UPI001068EE6F|nr:hypothetical protein [Candidatus Methylacidiphilum fumarolicum]TFE70847.1 hypothetical protein A7K73_03145 [Candidatus Methylacidiphilum fumarolicum]